MRNGRLLATCGFTAAMMFTLPAQAQEPPYVWDGYLRTHTADQETCRSAARSVLRSFGANGILELPMAEGFSQPGVEGSIGACRLAIRCIDLTEAYRVPSDDGHRLPRTLHALSVACSPGTSNDRRGFEIYRQARVRMQELVGRWPPF